MSIPDVHPALRDRSAELERLRPSAARTPITTHEDESQVWSAICLEPGCGWRRDGLPGLEPAAITASSHSAVTKLRYGKGHSVRPLGRITVLGEIISV